MSSVKLLLGEDKEPSNYGSLEGGGGSSSNGQPSASSSSLDSQNAAAYSSMGGMEHQQQKQQLSAVSFHDIHYQVKSLCTRKVKEILHGVRWVQTV